MLYEIGDFDDVVHDFLPIFAIKVDLLCTQRKFQSQIGEERRGRTPLILASSRKTPAITPRYGTFLTREEVSFNKLTAISNAPIFASGSGDWRISRGTERSKPLTVAEISNSSQFRD